MRGFRINVALQNGVTVGSDAVSFNPGVYLRYVPSGQGYWYYALHQSAVRNYLKTFINSVASDGFTGFVVGCGLSTFETSYGVYDFTYLDEIYDYLVARSMRMGLTLVTETQFLNSDSMPQYMLDDPSTYLSNRYASNPYEAMIRWWDNAGGQDRLISAIQALGEHYNDSSKFELCVLTSELSFTSYLWNSTTDDPLYTYANTRDSWQLICEAWHSAAPKKMGGQWFNDFKDDTLWTAQEYYAIAEANNIMWCNPNMVNYVADVSQIALCGMDYDGQLPGGGSSLIDYSIRIPVAGSGTDANDYYVDPHGPLYGTPYQSLTTIWNNQTQTRYPTDYPTGSGSSAHGPYTWNIASGTALPFMNCSHYIHFVNDEQGGDDTNQWSTAQHAQLLSVKDSRPSFSIPTCLVGNYITGG